MGKVLRRIGKFYSSIMMQNIGIFIFIGLLFVLFQENGWLPNENIYAISRFVYVNILPACVAYMGGSRLSGNTGGILAVLMAAGCISANQEAGILAGMLSAPIGGTCWKYIGEPLKRRTKSETQMLAGNLLCGILGVVLAVAGYYVAAPALELASAGLTFCVNELMKHRLIAAVSIVTEPAKILFLNNIINHGVLVPIGMEQLAQTGKSVLFLVETNPGPGLGMLAALYCSNRKKRSVYAAAITAQTVGGLHEVYFPEVLGNLWLLLPLSLAGAAGTAWFEIMDCGLQGAVSPGSVVTILMMAGKTEAPKVLPGILISAGVSFAGTMAVLAVQRKIRERGHKEASEEERDVQRIDGEKHEVPAAQSLVIEEEETRMEIRKIGFVCDAGVGSSAMGAALFRRRLAQNHIEGIEVEAYACDQIPEGLDIMVCQQDFIRVLPDEQKKTDIFPVESLMGGEEFERLIMLIRERNG